jgi:hypothetical protein
VNALHDHALLIAEALIGLRVFDQDRLALSTACARSSG